MEAAPDALEESTPALTSQPWSRSTPAAACAEISALWPVMPATTITTMRTATAATASSTSAAASARGMCRSSSRTTGIATTETMSAQTIGPVIVYVSASSQIEPQDEREHADQQPGAPAEVAEPARRRERAGQLRPPTSVVAVRGVHVTSSLTAPPDADLIPLG